MTQFTEPNHSSDLVAPRVIDWLQSLRAGVLEGLLVSPGSSGFLLDIASGKIVLQGTTIHDDLTRTDSTILSTVIGAGPLGSNTHVLVYANYTYTDTFPPAAMTLAVAVTTGSPPSPPSLPADSIKLADIFIPAGATDFTNADFVNAPGIPARGNADGDVLLERVVQSNFNLVVGGGGAITYDGVTDTLTWTEDLKIYATTVTNHERYKTAPVALATIAASSVALMGDNAIAFVVFDRTTVTPSTPSMLVLDLDTPAAAAMNAFFSPTTREQIVFVAMTVGGNLLRRAGFGDTFAEDVIFVSAGDIVATDVQAAIEELDTEKVPLDDLALQTGAANTGARLVGNDEIPVGTILTAVSAGEVRQQLIDFHADADSKIAASSGGVLDLQAFAQYGLGVISGFSSGTGVGSATVSVPAGSLIAADGAKYTVPTTTVLPAQADGTYILRYEIGGGSLSYTTLATGLLWEDMPLYIVRYSGGLVAEIEDCRMWGNGVKTKHFVSVGSSFGPSGANFTRIRRALLWCNCFQNTQEHPREIRVISDVFEPLAINYDGCMSFDSTVDPLLAGADSRLDGLVIKGSTDGTSNQFPNVLFGTAAREGYFIDFNLSDVLNAKIEGLKFEYNGQVDATNDEITVIKNAGRDFVCRNCTVHDGAGKLSHFAYWVSTGGANIELGGLDINDNGNGTIFEDIELDAPVDNTNYIFYVSAPSNSIDGHLTIQNSTFVGWGATGCYGVVVADDSVDCVSLSVTVLNMHLVGCEGIAFDIEADAQLQVSDSKFWYSHATTGAYQDVGTCGNATISNCLYNNTQDISLGATLYSNCRDVTGSGVAVANADASMVNCDFAGLTHTRLIQPVGVGTLTSLIGMNDNFVFRGLGLAFSDTLLYSVQLQRGVGFINGKFVNVDSSQSQFANNTANWVTTPTLPALADEYLWGWAFLRVDGTLRFDTRPPEVQGYLNGASMPDATYAQADYLFIGSFLQKHFGGANKVIPFVRTGDNVFLAHRSEDNDNGQRILSIVSPATNVVVMTNPSEIVPSSTDSPNSSIQGLICEFRHKYESSSVGSSEVEIGYDSTAISTRSCWSLIDASDTSRNSDCQQFMTPLEKALGTSYLLYYKCTTTNVTSFGLEINRIGYVEKLNDRDRGR